MGEEDRKSNAHGLKDIARFEGDEGCGGGSADDHDETGEVEENYVIVGAEDDRAEEQPDTQQKTNEGRKRHCLINLLRWSPYGARMGRYCEAETIGGQ